MEIDRRRRHEGDRERRVRVADLVAAGEQERAQAAPELRPGLGQVRAQLGVAQGGLEPDATEARPGARRLQGELQVRLQDVADGGARPAGRVDGVGRRRPELLRHALEQRVQQRLLVAEVVVERADRAARPRRDVGEGEPQIVAIAKIGRHRGPRQSVSPPSSAST